MIDSLFARVAATAAGAAGKPALTFVARDRTATTYTFDALFERVGDVGAAMARHRLPARTPVGILVEAQESQVLHYLAALSIGVTPAILTPPTRKMRRDDYLRHLEAVLGSCGLAAVVTDLPELAAAVPALEPYSLRPLGAAPRTGLPPADGAFLQFSSGTTGLKRGVVISDRSALAQIATYGAAIGLTSRDCLVSWLPLYHDMGFIACLNLPLVFGAHTVMLQPMDWVADPVLYLQTIDRFRGTLGWNPNFAYAFMADRVEARAAAALDLSSLRGLVNCSEPVTHTSQQRFVERFGRCGLRSDVFKGCYAMAETTFAVTHGSAGDPGYLDPVGPAAGSGTRPLVSAGRPLPGVECLIVDEAGRPCGDREVGEIWIRSPFTLSGYHNNPGETARALAGGWYHTGDLGYRAGAELFVCGRRKDMVIVGGANLYPQDIEEEVGRCAGVKAGRVAAFGAFDERLETERLVVMAETAAAGDPAALLDRIRQRVHAAFNVTGFEIELMPPGSLVKSSSGKIARGANRDRWMEQRTVAHRSDG